MNKIQKIRLIGFGVLATLSILIFLVGGPRDSFGSTEQGNWEAVAESINSRNRINNSNTSGAPQQTVVNGWTTVDWLELISEQVQTNVDRRVPALLLLLVVGACFEWATKDLKLEKKSETVNVTPR